MRICFTMIKDARILQTETIDDFGEETRTHKVFNALEEICRRWDLSRPIWLNANQKEFMQRAKTRFGRDNFVEEITFDYLEIHILEEDGGVISLLE